VEGEKMLNKGNQESKPRLKIEDFEFVSSVRSSVLIESPKSTQRVLWTIAVLVVWLVAWASWAEIDEITRGEGRIIPSGQLQVVQNLEGGIVKEILIKVGDVVKKGQPLLKIDNSKFASSYAESVVKNDELMAKELRLRAEGNNQLFVNDIKVQTERIKKLVAQEKSLYDINQRQLNAKIRSLKQQLTHKRSEIKEARSKLKHLQNSYELLQKEIDLSIPLAEQGVISEVDMIKLERDGNKASEEMESVKISIPGLIAKGEEIKSKIKEARLEFQTKARLEWHEVVAEIAKLKESKVYLKDQVSRTVVMAPVEGTVNQIFVHTVGGVVKPGMDLVEIVPSDDALLAEIKVKPQDIAFLFPGQKALVKFTAYDFAIFGGLKGEVDNISPDTITDEEGESFYMVRIKTHESTTSKKLAIIPGMTITVDILTGKKTVMDYLLKPIFKAKSNALSER
jgi:adhesin transport system membrane fusion protein